jgi:hypothetical protein
MQSAAAACICNLAANINSKEIIATSGVCVCVCVSYCIVHVLLSLSLTFSLSRSLSLAVCVCVHTHIHMHIHTRTGALEVLVQVLRSENQAAAAQAAGALWSLCVDNDMNKQRVADAGAIPHLIGTHSQKYQP